LWEKYKPGYWAGRNAIPMREAMVINKNGEAKYYRYEFLFNFYENLVDCEGTVTFNEDKTFTFVPTKGRKRHIDARHAERNTDRALNDDELKDAKWAGKRAYEIVPKSDPPTVKIKVPTSAAYNWYKKP
jgi:hypothetical protein